MRGLRGRMDRDRVAVAGHSLGAMTAPALVVVGDRDVNPMFCDQAEYRAGTYSLSPGPKDLLTVLAGEHILGGISGYDAAKTTDESPACALEAVAQLTWAYLRTALNPAHPACTAASDALRAAPSPLARSRRSKVMRVCIRKVDKAHCRALLTAPKFWVQSEVCQDAPSRFKENHSDRRHPSAYAGARSGS